MHRFPLLLLLLMFLGVVDTPTFAQRVPLDSPGLTTQGTNSPRPPSNSISHISTDSASVWIGTGKGLARSYNGGLTWESFRYDPAFATQGIFAMDVAGAQVWAATGYNKDVNDQSVQTGSGYSHSTDNGGTWTHLPQTLDGPGDSLVGYGTNVVRFLPVTVPEQNVTFDLDVHDSTVWIASWSSGIRKSTNNGQTWQRIILPSDNRNSIAPTDQLGLYRVDPRLHNNFLGFSVFVQNDSVVWAGTAGGINKSIDGGISWAKYTTLNQQSHILGNWIIAIKGQQLDSSYRVWCTNWQGDMTKDPNQKYGICYTEDGGRIWRTFLAGIKAYDFAFKGPITYVATDDGLFRTTDGGNTWLQSGTIIDQRTGQRITSQAVFSVGVVADTVYCGTGDGLVRTIDNPSHPFGTSWEIQRAYQPVAGPGSTYAYPNPFSPTQEFVRFHYSTGGTSANVTIEIFDFGMNRVRTVIKDAPRAGNPEYDEIWDGRNDSGDPVTNGVYFYRVILNNGDPAWGKVMVLQ
jgi:hypothetical protein